MNKLITLGIIGLIVLTFVTATCQAVSHSKVWEAGAFFVIFLASAHFFIIRAEKA